LEFYVTATIRLTIEALREVAFSSLTSRGVSEAHATAIADQIAAAERDGSPSHGLFRLPGYLKSVISGKVDPRSVPEVVEIAPSVLRVDVRNGFAPLGHAVARQAAIAMARRQGIAAVAFINSFHFSALWAELEPIAEQGIGGFAFRAGVSRVAPEGGVRPVFGTNPLGFAWPRQGHAPLVVDLATSAIARGEIQLRQRTGQLIPHGWAIDVDGNPTTDPARGLAGAQLTFGGYKGSALALMVELLAGPLVGDMLSFEALRADNGDGGPPRGGELLILFDPSRFVSAGSLDPTVHAERLFEMLTQQPGVRLPADRRYRARQDAMMTGITVSQILLQEVASLSGEAAANGIRTILKSGESKQSMEGL
jgi:LDH2 family malate/lactate/ureidoglycolate dehydrogenase